MKTAVFLCNCGKQLNMDFKGIAKSLKNDVDIVETGQYLCSKRDLGLITQYLRFEDDRRPDRIVIGACSPAVRGSFFKRFFKKYGIEVDLVNIREHVAWVHPDRKEATKIAKYLLKDAITRKERKKFEVRVGPDVAIIGSKDACEIAKVLKRFASVKVIGEAPADTDLDPELEFYPFTVQEIKGKLGDFTLSLEREKFIDETCVLCGECLGTCEKNAIIGGPIYEIDAQKCDSCGVCVDKCPIGAISIEKEAKEVKAAQIISLVKDVPPRPGIYDCYDTDPEIKYRKISKAVPEVISHIEGFKKYKAVDLDLELCANKKLTDKELGIPGCESCSNACHCGAISLPLTLREDICEECGACNAACPTGAIQLGGYSDNELAKKVKSALKAGNIIMFACRKDGYEIMDLAGSKRLNYSPVVPVFVPCLGRVDETVILRSFESGAEGIILLGCGKEGCMGNGFEMAEQRVSFVKKILDATGLESDRLEIIYNRPDDAEGFATSVTEAVEKIRGFGPLKIGKVSKTGRETKREAFAGALRNLLGKNISNIRIPAADLPFATVTIDDRCTLCGSCALHCNAKALVQKVGQIKFIHARCTACGICERICPENALRMEREINLKEFVDSTEKIFEQEMIACKSCNTPFASKNAFAKIATSLNAQYEESMKYCPECKSGNLMK